MANQRKRSGHYWPEELNRFHPYGRGYGRGRVQQTERRGEVARGSGSQQPLGFIADRSSAPPVSHPESTISKIAFVAIEGQRMSRRFDFFIRNLPPQLNNRILSEALGNQFRPYGSLQFDRSKKRTSLRVRLLNHASSPEFDPQNQSCHNLRLDGVSYPVHPLFRDIGKRLLHTEQVNYKAIEAHVVLVRSFDEQIHQIRNGALLSKSDLEQRNELRQFLEQLLNFNGYNCTVQAIGSSVTGLGLRDSDFDVFINMLDYKLKYEPIDRDEAVALLQEMQTLLRQEFEMYIIPVINARCPIIRIDFKKRPCNPNGLQCDMSISNILGTYNSQIMKHFLTQEPLFWDLAALIKYWLSARGLIGPNNITSYGCLLMVLFYLQSVHVLPSLYHLQYTVRNDLVEGRWNVAFDPSPKYFTYSREAAQTVSETSADDSEPKLLTKPRLSSLFIGFFNFYAKFPFTKQVICPYYGSPRNKGELLVQHELKHTEFAIQDLIQLNSNIGQNMTSEFFTFFRNLFKLVDHLIASLSPSLSDDEAARKILIKMIESVDDVMVNGFDVSTSIFQDQAKPDLVIKATTIDVTQEFLKTWSIRCLDIVEDTLRHVLQLTGFSRINLLDVESPPTHQSYIGQFFLVVRGSEHQLWQKRNETRKLLGVTSTCGSPDFVDEEKRVTQKIREDINSDDSDIEVDIAVSDDDVVCVSEQAVGLSDVSLSFKLLINFSINSQLLELRFEKQEEDGERGAGKRHDTEQTFWTKELKVFLSNYLLDHVQHVYMTAYS